MEVVRIGPELSETKEPLFLNHHITVTFGLALDPLSVSSDTVRITGADGLGVPGRLRVAAKSVTFEPNPPLSPSLDDGSFKPDATYRLELAGFPRANAIRAADGRVLEQTVVRTFRTMPRDASRLGYPSALLPVMRGDEPFRLRRELLPRMASDLGRLRLHFTLPPLPSTVMPAGFEVWLLELRPPAGRPSEPQELPRIGGSKSPEPTRVTVHAARVTTSPEPIDPFPGCTVELELDKTGLRGEGELVFVRLTGQPPYEIRDYLGRPVSEPPVWVQVPVDPGQRSRLLDEPFLDPDVLLPNADGRPGFVVDPERGVATPQLRKAAGSGALGAFRPRRATTLRIGEAFDRGDGQMVVATEQFEFTSIHVPAGVTVRLEAGERTGLRLLVCGSVVIDGELLIDAPWGDAYRSGERVLSEAQLLANRGVALIAGGDLSVGGRIRHLRGQPAENQSAMVLAGAGPMTLTGAIPPRVVLALEPNRRVRGVATEPIQVEVTLARGAPPSAQVLVESWSRWYALPAERSGTVDCIALMRRAGIEVLVQAAPQDPLHADRPFEAPEVLQQPVLLPLTNPLLVPPGGFLRFLLRAAVRGDGELPALDGLAVVGI